jgi:predicted cupin superfamily sugar epimerase
MNRPSEKLTATEVIEILKLKPHPEEGGYFAEVYRSTDELPRQIFGDRPVQSRSLSTSIFYLITTETFSALHRLQSDEVFHFYIGEAVTMLNLHPDGRIETVTLGSDIRSGQRLQHVVPRGVWQGCFLAQGSGFALMGTTVAPGFDFRDYEAGEAAALERQYPQAAELIRRLSP